MTDFTANHLPNPSVSSRSILQDRLLSGLYQGAVIFGVCFLLAPVVIILIISLSTAQSVVFPPPGLTLAQYAAIPPEIYAAFFRSVLLGTSVSLINAAICLPAAFALVRGRVPGVSLLEVLFRSPLQMPGIVLAVSFFLAYSLLLQISGISLRSNIVGLGIAHLIMTAPYMLTVLTGRVAALQKNLEDASTGLGAGPSQTFLQVMLPQLKSALLSGCFLSFVISFEDVTVALFLAPGFSQTTIPVILFGMSIDALSPMLFAASILILIFSFLLVGVLEMTVGVRKMILGS